MDEDIHEYDGDAIDVTWDGERCIHARECVHGLPEVFDTDRRPWIDPDGADADEVARVVERCPTGALHFERADGSGETTPRRNTVTLAPDGPLYLRGDVVIEGDDGETRLQDTRVALCRCGASDNKPLCDGTHGDEAVAFDADGVAPDAVVVTDDGDDGGPDDPIRVTPTEDGPFVVDGRYDLRDADGDESREGGALCRCGGSAGKPFCDGTHADIGFSSDD
ncbi:CDGSH iron-sulfur domain-containing protein [Haloglomus litoreum]|uniref:CDGSH iron-sulfur domain-containing protein n=1 Tax=Haloglomus litoreum TaxID=3034026 RepID=UPI0023E82421|nr:CDGSH iron-sulfur domain-containing protein [Haloglomus sp. DT116]